MDEGALAAFLERLESRVRRSAAPREGHYRDCRRGRPGDRPWRAGRLFAGRAADDWPDADRRSRLVVIGRDLDRERIERLFDGFLNEAAPDTPDRTALTDNPLAIAGGVGLAFAGTSG